MPRLSSFRFLWSTARFGVVSFLLLGLTAVVSAQGVSGGGPGGGMGGPASALGPANGMNGAVDGANGNVLTTVSSGIKRSDVSSSVRIQALLYSDTTFVARVNFGKVDYAGLKDFVDNIVDNGVGSLQSKDDYRVKLREYQKNSIKSSFLKLLSATQNAVSQRFYQNKIDDLYFIRYSGNQTNILAFPTDGLSDADQQMVVDAVDKTFQPYAIFNRYGFVVAIIASDLGARFDAETLKKKYILRNAAEQNQNSTLGGTNNFGANGMNATFGSSMEPTSGAYPNASGANGQGNELGISDKLYSEYQAELKAGAQIRVVSRKQILPFARRRFEKAASAEDGAKFFNALKQTDGAAFSCVISDTTSFEKILKNSGGFAPNQKSFDANSTIAGSFAEVDEETENASAASKHGLDAMLQGINLNDLSKNAETITLAVSLVGSPRIVAIVALNSPESAAAYASSIEASLALVKPLVSNGAQDFVKKNNIENADFSPLIDGFFTTFKPQVVENKVAMTLDFGVFKDAASALLPLFGGVEAKSATDAEAEEIDWNLGAEETTTEEPGAEETATEEPTAADAAIEEPKSEPTETPATEPEDDPFE